MIHYNMVIDCKSYPPPHRREYGYVAGGRRSLSKGDYHSQISWVFQWHGRHFRINYSIIAGLATDLSLTFSGLQHLTVDQGWKRHRQSPIGKALVDAFELYIQNQNYAQLTLDEFIDKMVP